MPLLPPQAETARSNILDTVLFAYGFESCNTSAWGSSSPYHLSAQARLATVPVGSQLAVSAAT